MLDSPRLVYALPTCLFPCLFPRVDFRIFSNVIQWLVSFPRLEFLSFTLPLSLFFWREVEYHCRVVPQVLWLGSPESAVHARMQCVGSNRLFVQG